MRSSILPGAALLLAPFVASPTAAQDAPALSLVWRSDAAADGEPCPGMAAARAAVAEELARDPFVGESAFTVDVEVRGARAGGERVATVVVRGAGDAELGRRGLRSDAQTCDELFGAIVLVLVLIASDPEEALPAEPPDPPPAEAAPAAELATPEPAAPEPAAPEPAATATPASSDARETPRATAPSVALFVGPSLGVQEGVLPRVVGEIGAVAWLRARGYPTLIASAGYTWSATAAVRGAAGASADLALIHGTLGVCVLESDRDASLVAVLCIAGRVGGIRSRGSGLDETHDETGLYISLPVSARADVPIAGPLTVGAWADLAPALVRARFVAQRGMEALPVHRVPGVAWSAGITLGVSLAFEDPDEPPTTP